MRVSRTSRAFMELELEDLIARHRPSANHENEPATGESLWHLNVNGLIAAALCRQLEHELRVWELANEGAPIAVVLCRRLEHERRISELADERGFIISRFAAWEIVA